MDEDGRELDGSLAQGVAGVEVAGQGVRVGDGDQAVVDGEGEARDGLDREGEADDALGGEVGAAGAADVVDEAGLVDADGGCVDVGPERADADADVGFDEALVDAELGRIDDVDGVGEAAVAFLVAGLPVGQRCGGELVEVVVVVGALDLELQAVAERLSGEGGAGEARAEALLGAARGERAVHGVGVDVLQQAVGAAEADVGGPAAACRRRRGLLAKGEALHADEAGGSHL